LGTECKILTCGNNGYEVLKFKDFQGLFIPDSKTFKDLFFPGPVKMDNFLKNFQGSVANMAVTIGYYQQVQACNVIVLTAVNQRRYWLI